MDFKIVGDEMLRTTICAVEAATVVEVGDFAALASGLGIKATASSAKIAWTPSGSPNGETQMEVTVGNDFVLAGAGDAVFAVAQRGTEVDLVVTNDVQLVDVGASTTDVLLVDVSENAGIVGSIENIRVKINKPLF